MLPNFQLLCFFLIYEPNNCITKKPIFAILRVTFCFLDVNPVEGSWALTYRQAWSTMPGRISLTPGFATTFLMSPKTCPGSWRRTATSTGFTPSTASTGSRIREQPSETSHACLLQEGNACSNFPRGLPCTNSIEILRKQSAGDRT